METAATKSREDWDFEELEKITQSKEVSLHAEITHILIVPVNSEQMQKFDSEEN